MRNWRVLTAVAAVVLAALAGVLVVKYTNNAKNDAKRPFTFVPVLIAGKKIPTNMSFATALQGKYIVRKSVVKQDIPETAIPDASDASLASGHRTVVASHEIALGQILVDSDFVAQGATLSGLSGQLASDESKDKTKPQLTAVTLTFDDQHAVGGFLVPGDTVNVMISLSLNKDHLLSGTTVKFSSFLLPGVKVLAVGTATTAPATTSGTTPSAQANSSRSLITFEVTPFQAEQLVQGAAVGPLTLTLNPPGFKSGDFKDPPEVVEGINLLGPLGAKPLPLVDQAVLKAANK